MPKPNLDDYITVSERIIAFTDKYPEGSLRAEILHDDGTRIVMRAYAYRWPTDPHPAVGHAEEIRGEGMVNKTSALENAETSAWGRAIAALGFHVKKGVASREEVEQAVAEEQRQAKEKVPIGRVGYVKQDHSLPEVITQEWVENARKRIAKHGEALDEKAQTEFGSECRMVLTSLNAGRLEDLTPSDAAKFDAWLSTQEKAKKEAVAS